MFSGKDNAFFGKKHTSEFITKLKQRTGEFNPMFNKAKSEFIAHMYKDRRGVNNPMFGKKRDSKMVWLYDVEKNSKLVFPTVMCTKTFHIGYETKDCRTEK